LGILFGFARKTANYVRGQGYFREACSEGFDYSFEVADTVESSHVLQDVIFTALHGQVNELKNSFILERLDQLF
jgi:hypothetical protein